LRGGSDSRRTANGKIDNGSRFFRRGTGIAGLVQDPRPFSRAFVETSSPHATADATASAFRGDLVGDRIDKALLPSNLC
jgi:hypothetical protein